MLSQASLAMLAARKTTLMHVTTMTGMTTVWGATTSIR